MPINNMGKSISFSSELNVSSYLLCGNEFAVLIDLRDFWGIEEFSEKILNLCKCGAKYFVCYGYQAELFHDAIDDVIIFEDDLHDVVTTFHVDESLDEVASFFKEIAMSNFNLGLVISVDEANWKTALR